MESPTIQRGRSGLPNRWAKKHGAFYYRVPPRQVPLWGKQWYRLGTTYQEAVCEFRSALAKIAERQVAALEIKTSLEEIASTSIRVTGPVIYFLIHGGEVVYVGKTLCLASRLRGHREKDFDSVATVACTEEEMDLLEIAYIVAFDPSLNIRISESGSGLGYFNSTG